jgi:hypothetical protein
VLQPRDRAEFVANGLPQIRPASTRVVTVSSAPGPTVSGPGDPGGIPTAHVIVTVTAVRAGAATIQWIDCSGTGC